MNNEEKKEMTFDERAVFGDCKTCGAKHGEKCVDKYGQQNGVHLGRLQAAPKFKVTTFTDF